MPLSIKSLEAEQLARKVAEKTGESITEAIRVALEERLYRLEREQQQHVLTAQLNEILNRVDRLPMLNDKSPEEIIGYDERGLPS